MPAVDYGVLSAWLDYWEELLEELRDLLLGN